MSKQKQPKRPKHIPQRTCVVCRQKTDKRQLMRLVHTADDEIVVDPSGKRNGRGAYVCDKPECWQKVMNTNILAQALKTAVNANQKAQLNKQRPQTITHDIIA